MVTINNLIFIVMEQEFLGKDLIISGITVKKKADLLLLVGMTSCCNGAHKSKRQTVYIFDATIERFSGKREMILLFSSRFPFFYPRPPVDYLRGDHLGKNINKNVFH